MIHIDTRVLDEEGLLAELMDDVWGIYGRYRALTLALALTLTPSLTLTLTPTLARVGGAGHGARCEARPRHLDPRPGGVRG